MKVFIQQPVVPSYRVPLFDALSQDQSFELEVHASSKVEGMPSSADSSDFKFKYIEHPCSLKLSGKAYFQEDMLLPEGYGEGDVLVYNSNARFLSNRKLIKKAKKAGCRLVAWNHADSASSGGLKSWIRKKMTASDADDLLLYTKGEAQRMLAQGWSKKNLYFLNNTQNEKDVNLAVARLTGVDDVIKARQSKVVKGFSVQKGLVNKKVILYCGRITNKANLSILIHALKLMSEEIRSKLHFIIIGDGDSRHSLQAEAEKAGLACFSWLGAIYGEENLAPWFLSAMFFIYPGAIGLSLNHSMSYGLPVLTHDVKEEHGPEFYYLKGGINGMTYEHGNAADLASKLSMIDSTTSQELSENAWSTMHLDYNFKNFVNNFINCLKGVRL